MFKRFSTSFRLSHYHNNIYVQKRLFPFHSYIPQRTDFTQRYITKQNNLTNPIYPFAPIGSINTRHFYARMVYGGIDEEEDKTQEEKEETKDKEQQKEQKTYKSFWKKIAEFYYILKSRKAELNPLSKIKSVFEKSRQAGFIKALEKIPPPAVPVIFGLIIAFFQIISQAYFGIRRFITFQKSVKEFCKIKHYKLLPHIVIDEERNKVLRESGDEVTGLIGQRGIGKTTSWVIALNGHEWSRGKLLIDLGDTDSTKQHWLDCWAAAIGYDMISRNLKGSYTLLGFFNKNVAHCCEEVTYAELLEYTENVMKDVKKHGYLPCPIFDGIREYSTSSEEKRSYLPLLENDIKNWLGTGEADSRLACAFLGSTHESLQNGLPELSDSKRLKFIEFRQIPPRLSMEIVDKYLKIFPVLAQYEQIMKDFIMEYIGGHPYFVNMAIRGVYTKITGNPCVIPDDAITMNAKLKRKIKKAMFKEAPAIRDFTEQEIITAMKNTLFKITNIELKGEDETKSADEFSYWDKAPESVIFRWAILFCFKALITDEFRKYILVKTNFKIVKPKRHEGMAVHTYPHQLTNLEYDTIFRYGLRHLPPQLKENMVKERFLPGISAISGEKIIKMEDSFLRANVLTKLFTRDSIHFSSTTMRKFIEEVIMLDIESEFAGWDHLVFDPDLDQKMKDCDYSIVQSEEAGEKNDEENLSSESEKKETENNENEKIL